MEKGFIVPTWIDSKGAGQQGAIELEHEKILFYSYPWEWSFSMLKDAALCTLNILKELLQDGYILKDGTALNVTYHKGKMVFIDFLSIDEYKEGAFWEGYNQFTQEFLYPLILQSYLNIPYTKFTANSLDGVSLKDAFALLGVKKYWKLNLIKNITIPYLLTRKSTNMNLQVKSKLPKQYLINLIEGHIKYINSLCLNDEKTLWEEYQNNNTYTLESSQIKKGVISDFAKSIKGESVIDLGANTGEYSLILRKHAKYVVSLDIDEHCIDRLYQSTKGTISNIYPLVQNLINPTGPRGWLLKERKSIYERNQTDYFVALALIHHFCIAHNISIDSFVTFLKLMGPKGGVVEWVAKEDPMIQVMLRNRKDIFHNYTWESFFEELQNQFKVVQVYDVNSTRKLCHVVSK